MSVITNLFKNIGKLFTSDFVATAAGTASGAGFGTFISGIWDAAGGKDVTKMVLEKILEVPPRAELQKVLLGLTLNQQKTWERRFYLAKTKTNTPSENDVVTAWCKPLLLKKKNVPLNNKEGLPILDKNDKPVILEVPGFEDDDALRKAIYEPISNMTDKEFWIWTDLLIHDKWSQKFEVWKQKFQQAVGQPLQKMVEKIIELIKKYSIIAIAAGKISLQHADKMTTNLISQSKNKKFNIF